MSFNKRVIIFLIVACITFYFLPVNTFAAAPAVSPSLPVGFTPFSDLPGNIENRFYQNFYDTIDYLFNGDPKKQIALKEAEEEIYISQQQAEEDFNNFFNDLANGVEVSEMDAEQQKQFFSRVAGGGAAYRYATQSIIDEVVDETIEELNFIPQCEIYGPVNYDIRERIDRINNEIKGFKDELGLVDNGKPQFSSLLEAVPMISNITAYDYATFDITIIHTDKNLPYGNVGDNVAQKQVFILKDLGNGFYKFLYVCRMNLKYFDKNIRYFVDFDTNRLCSQYIGNSTINTQCYFGTNEYPIPDKIYVFDILPSPYGTYDYYSPDPIRDAVITSDDLLEIPGVNPTYISDVEKAAKILAEQLGVDVNRILDEFSYVIDENGERYLESATGIRTAIDDLVKVYNESVAGNTAIINNLQKLLDQIKLQDISGLEDIVADIETSIGALREGDKNREALLGDISGLLGEINERVGSLEFPDDVSQNISTMAEALKEQMAINSNYEEFQKNLIPIINSSSYFRFPLYEQCKLLLENVFNYDDQLTVPNFDFYFDSDGDGSSEQYKLIDLSVLDQELNNNHMVDKSIFSTPIKVITFIRYILCACVYGLFVTRLLKRLPDFYGSSPWYLYPFFK